MNRTIQTVSTHSIELDEQEAGELREALRIALVVLRVIAPGDAQLDAAALNQADIAAAAAQLDQLQLVIA